MEPIYIYLFVMSAVTIAIRLVPLTLIRGQVRNQFIRSFLYYVPYVTLAVMTFPAILSTTQTPVSGALAFVIGIALAWYGASLFKVAAACCIIVFIAELGLR
ncbi:MAG: AzlD domain-containing protein [Selenomonadaceae bacterium]|nr:AzlD domain-containing protein [Selenomonadaceae bacterium]